MPKRERVYLFHAGRVEVGRPRNGRPGYAWVQAWTYRSPSGHMTTPARLSEARHMARQDFPGAALILSTENRP